MARILVIDDLDSLRQMFCQELEAAGHEVLEAGDGVEGLRAFRRQPIDLIVCDLFMPGKEGLETIRELRRESPQAKIVAMSGGGFNGTMDMLPAARQFGAVKVLQKPFGRGVLLDAAEEVLRENAGACAAPTRPAPGATPG